jgi:hypothetical protein
MEYNLTILICTMPDRAEMLANLKSILEPQVKQFEPYCTILTDSHPTLSIGAKRNRLLELASDDGYLAFIDDDDTVSANYVELIFEGIMKGVDCCSLTGIIDEKGKKSKFVHSLTIDHWYEKNSVYYRNPNHLNCVRADIAKRIGFLELNHGEDFAYSMNLQSSDLLKREHWIEQPIYFYDPSSNRK